MSPLSSEHSTYNSVKARCWSCLSGKGVGTLLGCSLLARKRPSSSLQKDDRETDVIHKVECDPFIQIQFALHSYALCVSNLVTSHSTIDGGRNARSPPCGVVEVEECVPSTFAVYKHLVCVQVRTRSSTRAPTISEQRIRTDKD